MPYLRSDDGQPEASVQQLYEYTVIPAPARGEKARGARTPAERFSFALLTEMNRMAANGWEYVRAETLPSEERSGLTSRSTVYHNVLVFRRALAPARPAAAAQPAPAVTAPSDAAPARPAAAPVVSTPRPAAPATPAAAPPADWPDAGAGEGVAAAQEVDAYDEPGFAPAPAETLAETDPAAPPAFTRRPPLAASTPEALTAPHRLGPAER